MNTENDYIAATARLAVEMWKMSKVLEKVIADLPNDKAERRLPQLRYSRDRLDVILQDAGLRLVTFDGEVFSANLPVTPVNADEFEDNDNFLIETTLEPSIVGPDKVIYTGKVVLAGCQ